jgi:trk system potassium uptake protein TrkA
MRVIVCGAGLVGSNIAEYLAAEGNQVTVIEQDTEAAARMSDKMDVQVVIGQATLPDVLERADAGNTDMIVAVTQNDEINMMACQVAHSLFEVPTKIARIRNQSFLKQAYANLFSRDHLPIDTIISPEIEVAQAIVRRLHVPGAFDTCTMADGRVRMVGVSISADTPILNTPFRQLLKLFPDLMGTFIGIVRNDRAFIPSVDDMLMAGDSAYLVCDERHTTRIMAVLGHTEPEARQIVIAGGGNVGLYLAQELEREFKGISVRLIERNAERAQMISDTLSKTVILNGDVLDLEILEEANIQNTETVVCVTDDDETNILTSLLCKRHGCQRAITLINKPTYSPLVNNLGINAVVNPRSITVSRILQLVRRGRIRSLYNVRDGFAELIEAEALEGSPVVGLPLRDIKLPEGVTIGAVVHGDEVLRPWPDTYIRAHDRVILLAGREQIRQVERMFSVRADFF